MPHVLHGKHLNICNTKNGEKRAAITRWCFYMYGVNNLAGNKKNIAFYVTIDRTTTARSALPDDVSGRSVAYCASWSVL